MRYCFIATLSRCLLDIRNWMYILLFFLRLRKILFFSVGYEDIKNIGY